MMVQTSRFGEVQVETGDFIDFPEGVLGFAGLRHFVLLDDPSDEIFAWLQSCEDGSIAFPILEPELFEAQYAIKLSKNDLEALKMPSQEARHRVFVIVTIPEDPTQMTANMKAPIVINVERRTARQCVLQDNHLDIRAPIFTRLQTRLVQFPTQAIKPQSAADNSEKWVHPGPRQPEL
jgi:flagellar assembly factor FliW